MVLHRVVLSSKYHLQIEEFVSWWKLSIAVSYISLINVVKTTILYSHVELAETFELDLFQ